MRRKEETSDSLGEWHPNIHDGDGLIREREKVLDVLTLDGA